MIRHPLFKQLPHIRGLLGLGAGISVLQTALVIGQMYLLSLVIHRAFMLHTPLGALYATLAALLLLIALRSGLAWVAHVIHQRGAIRIKLHLQDRLFSRLLDAGPARVGEERTGELTASLTEGVEKLDAYFARYLPRAIHVSMAPLGIALFVLSIDPLSGVLLLVTGPLIPVFMALIGGMARTRTQDQWSAMSRMNAHFLDVLQGLTTLKLFGQHHAQAEEIRSISDQYRLTTMGVLKIAFLSGLVLELAASLSTALVAVQIGVRLVEGMIAFDKGLFVLLLAPEFYLPFRQLGTEHHAAMEGQTAADRLLPLTALPVISVPSNPQPPPSASVDIHLEQVVYTYPSRTTPALVDITTTFTARRMHALVGPSGSGKSTLLKILLRYLDPDQGTVSADGLSLSAMDPTAWRRSLAYVSQHPALFHGTVRDNLRMARADATDEEMEEALVLAEAAEFVHALPRGLDTPLGEQAGRLSGGERQRIAMARAFLQRAPILLMDEPTAHLDPDNEERLSRAVERLIRDRTVILIAHRLRTVYRADCIHVLHEGRLAEQGAHDDLIEAGGLYARMIDADGRWSA